MLKRTIGFALVSVAKKSWIIISLILSLTGSDTSGQEVDPLFEAAQKRYPSLKPCDLPEIQSRGLCDTIEVYEDQLNKTGKKIPIEVIVLPATVANPLPSVFTRHWGGNGGAARDKIWGFGPGRSITKIRSLQDVLLIDDRGTGISNIRCAAMDSLVPNSYPLAYNEQLIRECLEEVRTQYNLSHYTTPYVVQDYETIRRELNIPQFDSYGISYGVRVGLEYMRQFPDRIRTLTLQGCVPPGFNYINEMDLAIEKQLQILFERCQMDSTCQRHYPNFKEEMFTVRDRLKEAPVKVLFETEHESAREIKMDDLLFRRMIGHVILNGNVNEAVPLIVHRAYLGNYVPLIMACGSLNLDMPVFLSQFCPEEVRRFSFNPESFEAQTLFTEGAIGREKVLACQWWLDLPNAAWLDEPLQSNSPILLLTGEYDANTGIPMAEQIHEIFPRQSRHIILPQEGHYGGVANDCRDQIIFEFIRDKELESLDVSCLGSVEALDFFFEIPLKEADLWKYTGEYTTSDSTKKLNIIYKNGMAFLEDEFTEFTGLSQLLYKGTHTFSLLDCNHCQIKFEVVKDKVIQVDRMYRETITFKPK
ncbi:MAG: alpha/beta hydrolase [Saprospiraceae bacterium]|nr:alpha/beta hydrolase [Saprospiraceae bacterium]